MPNKSNPPSPRSGAAPDLLAVTPAVLALLVGLGCGAATAGPRVTWGAVANNGTLAPDSGGGLSFFSYNQPSINDAGLVVFRARARVIAGAGAGGGGGEPLRGVFTRDMSQANAPVVTIASNKAPNDVVPGPNNNGAAFIEMPAFARIDARSDAVAFRGQSDPVLSYQTGVNPDGSAATTKSGTSGVYTNAGGSLRTAASQLGNVSNGSYPANPDLSYFQVPDTVAGTRFDQFPGAPTVTGDTVVFKGNWADAAAARQTGVYYRDVVAAGGIAPVHKIAASGDSFDNGQGGVSVFGSTAPPSASDGRVVFTGLDNEAAPTAGGIFLSKLGDMAQSLKSLVMIGATDISNAIGAAVRTTLNAIGEGLSFNGSKVGFWGSWGSETRQVTVSCPTDGNASRLAACLAQDDNGVAGDGIYNFDVAAHQGIFLVDTETGEISLAAQTGSEFDNFLFWTFSGAAEAGPDEADQEPPRWRSSAFTATDGANAAFKALKTGGQTGLYGAFGTELFTFLETGMDGGLIDASAAGMQINSVGMERDGFRNGRLVFNAGMANAEASWAGIYVAQIPEPDSGLLVLMALGGLAASAGLRRRKT